MEFVEDRHEYVSGDEADGRLGQQHRRVLGAEHVNLGRHPQHRHPGKVAGTQNILIWVRRAIKTEIINGTLL